jgi:diguanylate cyclase (GGDEF)-like protein
MFFKNKIRTVDTFIRWGGEEFIILLPYTDKKESMELADRLKTSLAKTSFEHGISITCSVGVTVLNDDDNYKSFVDRADKAQYKSKNEGKNRVTYM